MTALNPNMDSVERLTFSPHPYQLAAIRRLEAHSHYGLFLDMGLGKTITTLTAIQDLIYDMGTVSRVLIIAPKTVAESTWQDEAEKWEHLHLTFSTILGDAAERRRAMKADADCYVINRENVSWLCKEWAYELPYDMLVVDESSSFKNPAAKRFKDLRKAMGSFSRVVILTGTPAPNSLIDLWAQVYLLDRGQALGKTISAYRAEYFSSYRPAGAAYEIFTIKNKAAEAAIYKAIAPEVMSLKAKDYLTLPSCIKQTVRVTMPKEAKKEYERLEKDFVLNFDTEKEITVANAAVLSGKLLQLANGRVYTDTHGVYDLHSAKLDALKELIEAANGSPVLVFYSFRHDLDRLKTLKGTTELQGDKEIKAWNAGKIPILLAHPASCAYGINLQRGGHIIVWYGLTWSLEQYQQANARLYRQGQTHPVTIYHLVTRGTMDEQVMGALSHKRAGQDALLEAVKAKICEVQERNH